MTRSTRCFKTKNVRTKKVFCPNDSKKSGGKGEKNCRRIVKEYVPCRKGSVQRQLAFMQLRAREKARKRYKKNKKATKSPQTPQQKTIERIKKKLMKALPKKDFAENYVELLDAFEEVKQERIGKLNSDANTGYVPLNLGYNQAGA
jgi:hypothetical protein